MFKAHGYLLSFASFYPFPYKYYARKAFAAKQFNSSVYLTLSLGTRSAGLCNCSATLRNRPVRTCDDQRSDERAAAVDLLLFSSSLYYFHPGAAPRDRATMTAKTTILLFALCAPQLATAFDVRSSFSALWSALRRDDGDGYYDPNDNGGSMLTVRPPALRRIRWLNYRQEVDNTYPEGLGEPLNMIFSGSSDADVLVDQETDGGFRNYWL